MAKHTRNEFTFEEFLKRYPDDDSCLAELFQRTYGTMTCCPKCSSSKGFVKVRGRRSFQCRKCYYQVYPCKGTAFENSKLPLQKWFFALYLFSTTRNGLAAHDLFRKVKVSLKTAYRMLTMIRENLNNDESQLCGEIEIDEAYVGGKNKNRHKDKKYEGVGGRSTVDKALVFGMIERNSGRAVVKVATDATTESLHPLIYKHVTKGSTILSDEFLVYRSLKRNYIHAYCNHRQKVFVSGNASTNKVENFWSLLKRTLGGGYVKVSRKYLQRYVDEVVFRYNHRNSSNMFADLLMNLTPSSPYLPLAESSYPKLNQNLLV